MHSAIDITAHTKPLNSLEHMRNLDDKHPTRPGFDPINYDIHATAGSNGSLGRHSCLKHKTNLVVFLFHQIKYKHDKWGMGL